MAGVGSRGLFLSVPSNTNIKTFPLVLRHPFTIERSGICVMSEPRKCGAYRQDELFTKEAPKSGLGKFLVNLPM